jgi:O-antigen/teichoic acid export membrane protein
LRFVTKAFGLRNRIFSARSLHTDATVTAATNLALAAMGFGTGIITARMLGPHGRGELAAIQTTPSAIGALAMIGMPEALVYFSAQRPARAGRYLGTATVLALAASVPLVAIGYLAMPLLVRAQGPDILVGARSYLLIAALYATTGMLYHPLRGCGDFHAWNALRLMVPVAAFCVLAVAYVADRKTPAFIALGNLTSYALLFVPCAWIVGRRLPGPFAPDTESIRPMLRFGFPCVMTSLPYMLNLRLDQMMMAAMLPARDLGLYVVAVAWSGAVSPLLNSIGSIMLPSVASANDSLRAAECMGRGVRMTAAFAIVICAAVASAAPLAIPIIFGASYRASLVAALILVPAAGVLGVNFTLQESIRGFGRPYIVLYAELMGLTVSATVLATMLRPLGIIGAAVASLLGYSTVTMALLFSAQRIAPISIAALIMPRPNEIKRGIMRLAAVGRGPATPPA